MSLDAIAALTRAIDRFSLWCGRLVAWLVVPMVLSLVYEVVARYFFNMPTAWAYDMTFILYGTFFMLGSAYTLMRKGHIRTDTFYANWSPRRQGVVDAICYLAFFFPAIVIFGWLGWEFFWKSFQQGERFVTSPWMPAAWPLKFMIPLAATLLVIQGISEVLKSIYAAVKNTWPPTVVAPIEAGPPRDLA